MPSDGNLYRKKFFRIVSPITYFKVMKNGEEYSKQLPKYCSMI